MSHGPVNRKEYWIIFVVLAVLTVLEVGVAMVHGQKVAVVTALIGLALAKAAIVALFYMHLKHETKILKLSVAIPLATPIFYALVLVSEGVWRHFP